MSQKTNSIKILRVQEGEWKRKWNGQELNSDENQISIAIDELVT